MVDVVVVTRDSCDMALKCLAHLGDPAIARVVLVDNGSRDGTADRVRQEFPEVSVVRLEEDTGLARAFNRGAEAGQADHVLFLNDDIFASPGVVSRLLEELQARPAAASAGGRLVEADGSARTQDRYRPMRFPTFGTFFMALTGLDRIWPANPWSGAHLRHRLNDSDVVVVDQPAGACLLVPRSVFERIGGWDEGYWVWFEDVDISRRLSSEGPAIYVPEAHFEHLGGGTARRLTRAELVPRTHHGIVRYASQHLPRRQQMALATLLVALSVPWLVTWPFNPELARAHRGVIRAALTLAVSGQAVSLRDGQT